MGPSQIVIGLVIAFSSSFVYAQCKPFVQVEDEILSEICECQIFFVLLAALVSMISAPGFAASDVRVGDMYSEAFFGALLVFAALSGPAIAAAMIFIELREFRKNSAHEEG